jgi:hypothetical protein
MTTQRFPLQGRVHRAQRPPQTARAGTRPAARRRALIAGGAVRVDGTVETRIRRKLRAGNVVRVEWNGQNVLIVPTAEGPRREHPVVPRSHDLGAQEGGRDHGLHRRRGRSARRAPARGQQQPDDPRAAPAPATALPQAAEQGRSRRPGGHGRLAGFLQRPARGQGGGDLLQEAGRRDARASAVQVAGTRIATTASSRCAC